MKDDLDISKNIIKAEKSKLKHQNKKKVLKDRTKRYNIEFFELEDNLDDIWFSLWNGI